GGRVRGGGSRGRCGENRMGGPGRRGERPEPPLRGSDHPRLAEKVIVGPPVEPAEKLEPREARANQKVLELIAEEPAHPRSHCGARRRRAGPASFVAKRHVHDLSGGIPPDGGEYEDSPVATGPTHLTAIFFF